MPTRVSLIFQSATNPTDRTSASAHAGGWSEGWWQNGTLPSGSAKIPALAQIRARMLGALSSIIGYRLSNYNIVGNKLQPTGTSTGKFLYPGNPNAEQDLPQVALQFSGATQAAQNASRFTCRSMPDQSMIGGEYQPNPSLKGIVTQFGGRLVSDGWGFVGRDLTLPVQRVISIVGNVVKLSGLVGAVEGVSFLRLIRVRDTEGDPVTGSYLITALNPATFSYTLANFPGATAGAVGMARVDSLVFNAFSDVQPVRAVVRKIGRPFESYRGRASKRAV